MPALAALTCGDQRAGGALCVGRRDTRTAIHIGAWSTDIREMKIELNCAECGENRFALDAAVTDACAVRCFECGHEVGTMGELKNMMALAVIARAKLA